MASVALALLVLIGGTIINRNTSNSPRPTPDRAFHNESATPARLSDIQDALQAADRSIVERSWSKAESHATRAKEMWLSYRAPMQASAGRRMWSTDISQEFQSDLNGLLVDIAERQPERARRKIRGMLETIDMHGPDTEGRLDIPDND